MKLTRKQWGCLNKERCELIDKDIDTPDLMTKQDRERLAELQRVADGYLDTVAPLPLDQVRALARELGLDVDCHE